MKIKIKTSLITLEIEDDVSTVGGMSLQHALPDLPIALKAAIDEAIRLHNEANKSYGV